MDVAGPLCTDDVTDNKDKYDKRAQNGATTALLSTRDAAGGHGELVLSAVHFRSPDS